MRAHVNWALCVGMLAALCGGACRADIYEYSDAQGVAHFSNVPVDSRYRLLIASDKPLNTGKYAAKARGWLTKALNYDPLIEAAASANTVNPALIRALIVVESGFNPRALSKRGAVGLMQLLPATARRYGVSDIYDPAQNIRAGTHYLSDLITMYDSNTELALAAYNAGEAAVAKYGGRIPPFKETREYVPSVLKMYRALMAEQRAAQQS